jgi:hypothetical protein
MENNTSQQINKMTYAFKHYIQNGMGADLVRLTSIISNCDKKNIIIHLAKNDIWDHVPNNTQFKNWEYYFDCTERLPLDFNDEYPIIPKELANCTATIVPSSMNCSKFEYRSKLMREIYKPNKKFTDDISKHILKYLPFLENEKYIAIHIRRGDKTAGPWKESDPISVQQYLKSLKEYVDKNIDYPIIAYVITDSEEVIKEISANVELYEKCNIFLKWDQNETRRDGYSYKLYKYGYNDTDRVDEIFTFMKNLYIMQLAIKLIGSRMSFYFITAELLRGQKEISLSDNKKYPVDFYD